MFPSNLKWISLVSIVPVAMMLACGEADSDSAADAEPAEEAAAAVEVNAAALAAVAMEYSPEVNVDLARMRKSESGLYTEDILPGEGEGAVAGDVLRIHYTGWLPDGTMFDSSMDGDEPIQFTLGAGTLIRGWDEGVVGMKVGGRRRLVIPPGLGFGAEIRSSIPPMSTLVFMVDLVEIVK